MSDKEIIRINNFRQFKKSIRASKTHLIVGLDIAKDKHVAFMGTARGQTLRRRLIFRNDIGGFNKLLEEAVAVQKQHGLNKIVFGLEPTGNYHKPLARWLILQNRTTDSQWYLAKPLKRIDNYSMADGIKMI